MLLVEVREPICIKPIINTNDAYFGLDRIVPYKAA